MTMGNLMSCAICNNMKGVINTIVIILFCFALEMMRTRAQDISFPDYMPPRIGSENIWFIHGWQPAKFKPTAEWYSKRMKETFDEEVYIYSWDAAGTWSEAKQKISTEAKRLAEKVSICSAKQRSELILVGHSLGARMITEASQELIEKGIKVKQVIFLGGAVNFDTPQLNNIEKISTEPPINVFNREDGVLKNLYSSQENVFACGNSGIGIDTKFRQFEVSTSDKTSRAIITQITNNINHSVIQYLETLKPILQNKAEESLVPRLEEINMILEEVGVPKVDARTPLPPSISVEIIEQTKK